MQPTYTQPRTMHASRGGGVGPAIAQTHNRELNLAYERSQVIEPKISIRRSTGEPYCIQN